MKIRLIHAIAESKGDFQTLRMIVFIIFGTCVDSDHDDASVSRECGRKCERVEFWRGERGVVTFVRAQGRSPTKRTIFSKPIKSFLMSSGVRGAAAASRLRTPSRTLSFTRSLKAPFGCGLPDINADALFFKKMELHESAACVYAMI